MEMIVLPGIGGSGKEHWQSRWQVQRPGVRRFQPANWDQPNLNDWIAALDREVLGSNEPPLLVAHSLACLLVAHWAKRMRRHIAGAFLVAVPDPSSAAFPTEAKAFAEVPTDAFSFPSIIVASTNDPFGSLDYAKTRALQWGSELIVAGALGHLNGSSGLGDWTWGATLLDGFAARVSA
jgi:predicted alpha/beta hydrolase family esterase